MAENERIVIFHEDEYGCARCWTDKGELVRCENCYYGITGYGITDGLVLCAKPYATDTVTNAMHRTDWFCADGKRKKQSDGKS